MKKEKLIDKIEANLLYSKDLPSAEEVMIEYIRFQAKSAKKGPNKTLAVPEEFKQISQNGNTFSDLLVKTKMDTAICTLIKNFPDFVTEKIGNLLLLKCAKENLAKVYDYVYSASLMNKNGWERAFVDQKDIMGNTALHYIADNRDVIFLGKILDSHPEFALEQNILGNNFVHNSIMAGDEQVGLWALGSRRAQEIMSQRNLAQETIIDLAKECEMNELVERSKGVETTTSLRKILFGDDGLNK